MFSERPGIDPRCVDSSGGDGGGDELVHGRADRRRSRIRAGGKVFRDAREMIINAPDSSVYEAVCRIGGKNGWSVVAAGWLWGA